MPLPLGEYRLEFDAPSVARLNAMMGAAPIFARYYLAAMNACVNQVATRAKLSAPVGVYEYAGRTGGTLRRGIRGYAESPWVGRVGVGKEVPYARRREFGFDNQTDRLGRYYALDPADDAKRANMFYLRRALQASQPYINAAFLTSTRLAIAEMNVI